MTIAAVLLGLAVGGLVLLYLTRQRFDPLQISAARFFADLPTTNELSPQLRLQNLLLSPSFYLQLAMLLLLLLGVLYQRSCVATAPRTLGVWFLVDTSASMETAQAGTTRAALAQDKLAQAFAEVSAEEISCVRLSAFDMERRDLVANAQTVAPLQAAAESLTPRPLGTDLTRLRAALTEQQADCPISHLYVISDQPPPEWMLTQETPLVVWQDVGAAVDNVGFTTLDAVKNPLTGLIQTLYLEVTRYGETAQSTVRVTDPNGAVLAEQPLTWNQARSRQVQFTPTVAGIYTAQLLETDAYVYDDVVTLRVVDAEQIRVDWQLADEAWLDLLGWRLDRTTPQLRVVPVGTPLDATPTLVVGDQAVTTQQRITYFDDDSPLLADLNLDLAEQLGMTGVTLPDGMQTVLSGENGVWLAQRQTPPAAYVPALPRFPIADDAEALTATMFFNGVRWLLQGESAEPFFTLTSPAQPAPSDTHLVLHLGEGDTRHSADPNPNQPTLTPAPIAQMEEPIWPRLLAGAAVFLLIERLLAVFGGRRWQ